MTFYAWTISKPGRQDIKKLTSFGELCDYLRVLDLPGVAPPKSRSIPRCMIMVPVSITRAVWRNGH